MTELQPPGQETEGRSKGRRALWSIPGVLVAVVGIAIAVIALPAAVLLWLLSIGTIPLEATFVVFLVIGVLTFVVGLVLAILPWRRA